MERRLQIAIDCADPERLAAFWAAALDYELLDPPGGHSSWEALSAADANEPGEQWRVIDDPTSHGPRVLFHTVPEPKTTKNRVHLDVWLPRSAGEGTEVVEAEAARLEGLGATRIRTRDDDGEFYIVMQDPEGNEFCIA